MSLPKRIEITEVGPRDGWQNHKAMIIPTEVKAKYVKKMIDAGADKIEVTAFVNPKAVPQMANAKDLVALVQPYAKEKGCQTIGLALNKRGVDDAVAAGVDYVGFGISVSEEHNKRNSNRKRSILMYADFHSGILYCFSPLFLPVPIWDLCLL